LVETILLHVLLDLLFVQHFFHSPFLHSVGIKDLEQLSELVFLTMIPVLNENHGSGSIAFCEVGKIHEGALVELINGDVSKPDEELFLVFI